MKKNFIRNLVNISTMILGLIAIYIIWEEPKIGTILSVIFFVLTGLVCIKNSKSKEEIRTDVLPIQTLFFLGVNIVNGIKIMNELGVI